MLKEIILFCCFGISIICCDRLQQDKETELIPRSVLLAKPDKFCVSMSYVGDKIAYLARKDSKIELCVEDLSGNLIRRFDIKESRGAYGFIWAYTGNHILIGQDNNGDENEHVICLDISTGTSKDLTPFKGVKSHAVKASKKHPHEIIIVSNKNDPKWFNAYRVNIITGKIDIVFRNTSYTTFNFDHDLNLRIVSKVMLDGSQEDYLIRNGKPEFFRKVSFDDTKNTSFMYFDKNNKIIYGVDSIGRDKSAFIAYDLQNKTSKILFESDLADVECFTYDPNTFTPQCFSVKYLKPKIFVADDSISKDIAYLESQSDEKNFDIVSRNFYDDTWIISYYSSNYCRKYYLYKRDAKKHEPLSLKFLFTVQPSLEKYRLQEKIPLVIKSRDGLDLVCYLTKSADFQKTNPRKLIVYVHGGPWVRDSNYYDPEVQLLANRGYSVLQINYRGSTGFGKKFTNAANGNLDKIRNDIIDGVNWAVANKIADKEHVAIMGGSWGGYSTLAGLAFTPDIFCCGVDVVGPSNFITLLETIPPYWLPDIESLYKLLGNLKTEDGRQLLLKNSPITHANEIKKPLIVFHGKNDPRVKQNEAEQIVDALKEKGLPVVYVLYPDEGHGFLKELNKKSYMALTEIFLAKIMGGRFEPMHPGEFNGSSHEILEGKEILGLQ